jgi:H+-transporting ATPase
LPSDDKGSPSASEPLADVLIRLSSSKRGLTSSEAVDRLMKYGPNEITEKKQSAVVAFLRYFWGPIPWMIEAAAVISAAIQHWSDLAVIAVLLAVNAVVGFFEESKADDEIELLKKRLAANAIVLRDGRWAEVPTKDLVPGDVVRLRLGNVVPADARLLAGSYLLSDESALTGESLPSEKHLGDLVYSSSIVKQGEMDAVVVGTGMDTFFGKTTRLASEAEGQSHFQKAVVKIGDYLIALAAFLVVTTSVVELFRGQPFAEILQFGLVLTVAAIPAALPAVLSVSMAVGAEALAKKEAIVSKLVSIEEMAGVDILCADKTGTITMNELSVGDVLPMHGYTQTDVLAYAAMASRSEDKDPIDDAVVARTSSAGAPSYDVVSFAPFDPVSKRTEAEIRMPGRDGFKVSKGAPQAVLSLVGADPETASSVDAAVQDFASKGYRSLGVAVSGPAGWSYAGVLALFDPPREDSASTIAEAKELGLKVKMITGDHQAIAKEIAGRVGLGANIVTATAVSGRSDAESERAAEQADGFAEVFPEHKYRIVDLLQRLGHIVCMTGDGVNDAPALKKADAGVAVAGATDAAKSAADVVLTKPGLSVIVDSIKESRKIFQRMTNYSIYRITETIRVLLFITVAIIAFQFYPVTALMIVLLALLNDMPIMTIAYDNVQYSPKPERWNMRTLLGISTFLGATGVVSSFGLLYIGLVVLHLNLGVIQSFILLKLAVAGHLTLFAARTRGPFWSIRPAKPLLLAVVSTKVVATLMTVYGVLLPAIGWNLAILVWGYALLSFVIQDFLKVRFYRLLDHSGVVFRR